MDQITFTKQQYRNLRHTLHHVFDISSGIFPELAAFGNYRNDRSDAVEHEFSNLLFLLANVRPPSAKTNWRSEHEAPLQDHRSRRSYAGNQTGESSKTA